MFAASGGKLLGYYLTFGDFDFLLISEGPSEGVATSTIAAAASGEVTDLKTQLAIPASAMVEAFNRAGPIAAGFRAPQAESQGTRAPAQH
ncbi:GYD domain-containing protein [Rhodanobacter umsongensis]|uniref:GYD domain-containing protein n=1 Tax=Rhodanobacter umsongensis TaxID=633153 RepID=A0ABW0JH87_9GAMM